MPKDDDRATADPGAKARLAPEAREGISSMGAAFKEAMKEGGETPPPKDPPQDPPPPKDPPPPQDPPPPKDPPKEDPPSQGSNEENIREMRIGYNQQKQRVAELEAELGKFKEGTKKYEGVEEKLAAAEQRAAELDVFRKRYELETSDEFGKHYQQKISDAAQDAKDALPDRSQQIEELFAAPQGSWREARIKAMVSEVEDDYGKQSLILAYNKLKTAQRERDAELKGSAVETNYDKLKEMREAQQAEQANKLKAVRDNYWNNLEPDLDKEFADAVAAEDKARIKNALRGLISGQANPNDVSDALKSSARGYRLSKAITEKDKEIEGLKAQLAELQTATPRVGGSGKAGKGGDKESMGDIFRRSLKGG